MFNAVTLKKAVEACNENMTTYTSATKDPALFNVSLALKGIAAALERLESDIEEVKRRR